MIEDEDRFRARIHQALEIAPPERGLQERILGSMPVEIEMGRPRWHWVTGVAATLLAAMVVGGFIFVRAAGGAHSASSGRLVGSLTMDTRLGFRCVLPVQGPTTQARISLPDGGVTVDQVMTGGKGSNAPYGNAYVRGRWLPVSTSWVSPDGRFYAYATHTTGVPGQPATSGVFVHDIASSSDRRLWSGDGNVQMLGWGPGGVYFTLQPAMGKGYTDVYEVWVADPATTAGAHRVGPNPAPTAPTSEFGPPLFAFNARIASGGVWAVRTGSPIGPMSAGGGYVNRGPDQVVRMDLKDGSVSTWFTTPDGFNLGLAGVDSQGHPVLVLYPRLAPPPPPSPGVPYVISAATMYPPAPRVLLLTGPGQTVTIADGSDTTFRPTSAFGDSHGIWFTSPGSLWLYARGELVRVGGVPEALFPKPTPPPGAPTPPANITIPSPPPGYPTGTPLMLGGPCG